MKRKKSVGQISSELKLKEILSPSQHTVAEQGKEMLKDYMPNLLEATNRGVRENPKRDFYVVVLTKQERLMDNVFRHYFFYRLSCPTPTYDQAVYFYSHTNQTLEFIWVVPDIHTCRRFLSNSLSISPDEKCVLEFVMKFNDGTLEDIARQRNGEKENQVNPTIHIN